MEPTHATEHGVEVPRPRDPVSLAAMNAKLDALAAHVGYLVEQQRKTEELFAEMSPILRAVMGSATQKLDGLEKLGYFAFGGELLRVGERIVEGFSPEDVRQLGGAIVGILETVRALTQPEVLRVAADASEVLQHAERAEPIGLLGMVRATSDHEVQKGMSVLMELMRHVGRAASVVREQRESAPMAQKRARLGAITAPRRSGTLGTERGVAPASAAKPSAGPGYAAPTKGPAPAAATIEGVGFGADGHLADARVWTPALGARLAAIEGIALADAHWKLVEAARADFEATKVSPNIRRLTQVAGVSTRDVYALFPKAPARTLAKIAGLPKPAGCL